MLFKETDGKDQEGGNSKDDEEGLSIFSDMFIPSDLHVTFLNTAMALMCEFTPRASEMSLCADWLVFVRAGENFDLKRIC